MCKTTGKVVRLAVDAIIEDAQKGILFIERRFEPFGWAIPRGFVDYGESVEKAVHREILEETSLEISQCKQFHVYSKPDRDPRGIHVASVVFIAQATGNLKSGDDAKNAVYYQRENLPKLVFDHDQVIADYMRKFATSPDMNDYQ